MIEDIELILSHYCSIIKDTQELFGYAFHLKELISLIDKKIIDPKYDFGLMMHDLEECVLKIQCNIRDSKEIIKESYGHMMHNIKLKNKELK